MKSTGDNGTTRIVAVAAATALATVLVACGAEDGSAVDYGVSPTAVNPARVTVEETEFSIALSSAALSPGTYTFVVQNNGNSTHDLVIEGPGVNSARSETVDGGETTELTVALQPGTYELWCSVGSHREFGMSTMLMVS
ncbi:cupredoxin domain-containing protein [Nocardia cyriacigeorgica]|nr:cupredoxin domain-containing protein [Nocardia cyriacigeorgica]MBF6424047.1 cupredoxin domain-containing protein [Nocardia cyriacigeorgica]TLF56686.1 hypothetical protein FEK31_15705 [Nocardia cyriacigeorgica]VFA98951.1 Uncharacterized copper-binding protein [Nocardia cyriacigeorgica]